MTALRFVCRRGTAHDTLLVYVGPDPDHRALAGTLTMRRTESDATFAALTLLQFHLREEWLRVVGLEAPRWQSDADVVEMIVKEAE